LYWAAHVFAVFGKTGLTLVNAKEEATMQNAATVSSERSTIFFINV
jgi:hypothetical protein